jgi:hypothetical protein
MFQPSKMIICIIGIVFWVSACGTVQPSGGASALIESTTSVEILEPASEQPPAPTATEPGEAEATESPTATQLPAPKDTPEAEGPGEFQQVTSLGDLDIDAYESVQLYALDDGTAWIISSQAVLRWDGGAWDEIISGYENILAFVDDLGRFWMLQQETGEITSWQEGEWLTYGEGDGWQSVDYSTEASWWLPEPWKATMGADNTIWLPMSHDVRTFDGQKWRAYSLDEMGFPLPEYEEMSITHSIAIPPGEAEVWVGECYYSGPGPMGGQGVRWFDGEAWHEVGEPVGPGCVSALTTDPDGNVWLGLINSAWKYELASQAWTPYSVPKELYSVFNFTHPRQLIIDRQGDAWMIEQLCGGASCDGPSHLVRLHDGAWSVFLQAQYWYSPLKQLALDGSGQAWAFWEGMVYRLAGDALQAAIPLDALGVDVSPDGKVWVVAKEGNDNTLWVMEP